MKHGIFELPLNLKRSHFSYAHTDEDVDRLLEATEEAVQAVLARARVSDPAVSCTIDLTAPGKQIGRLQFAEDLEHRRLGVRASSRSRRSPTARARRCSSRAATTATSTKARSPRSG